MERDQVKHFRNEKELLDELNSIFSTKTFVDELERKQELDRMKRETGTESLVDALLRYTSAEKTRGFEEQVQDLNRHVAELANSYYAKARDPLQEKRNIYCSKYGNWNQNLLVVEDTSGSKPTTWDSAPSIYIPATRISLKTDYVLQIEEDHRSEGTLLKGMLDAAQGNFYGQDVELAIDRLRKKMVGNRILQYQFRKAMAVGYSCTKAICAEVIYDDVPHTFVELREIENPNYPGDEIPWDAEKVNHYGMGIGTNDDITGEPLYAGDLSSGTQGTLLWVWALVLKMADHYDWESGWEKKPAILLIDEIENHLHPTWQRRVIPALLEHFPGLQIFATTHSPFVVAGLKAGQVHLLHRDENGVVTATTNTEDVVGWTADEILRTMMGVEDPTDAETAAAARELRRLRNEAPRSDPADEEKRQPRIQELRQLVDRDLLAGGPMAAQRELFEEQFAEALKKYQQYQDLNQENR